MLSRFPIPLDWRTKHFDYDYGFDTHTYHTHIHKHTYTNKQTNHKNTHTHTNKLINTHKHAQCPRQLMPKTVLLCFGFSRNGLLETHGKRHCNVF